jgi:8-amino-7-oxononanoate synthase
MRTEPEGPCFDFLEQLADLKESGLFRQRKAIESAQAARIVLDGRTLLNFCSNDYLGLANDPRIVKSFQRAAEKYGVGSGASPLVCGRSTAHVELEEEVARITGRDKALIFSSGYLANLAIVGTFVTKRSDLVLQDKLNHASMIDASLLSRAKLIRFPHADVKALETILCHNKANRKLVLTDSVFSMDGDIAPLGDLAITSAEHQACLIVDDAHGFGVFGDTGGGMLEHLALTQLEVPLMMATFGKAAGCAGAFVAGTEKMIELMVQKARPYIYSTALAPALAVAATQALQLMEAESWRREHLSMLIKRFRESALGAGLPLQESFSAIQPLIIGAADKALAISDALLKAGILITAIRPPTVPRNSSRLRITLSAAHKEEDIDVLVDALAACCLKSNTEFADHA